MSRAGLCSTEGHNQHPAPGPSSTSCLHECIWARTPICLLGRAAENPQVSWLLSIPAGRTKQHSRARCKLQLHLQTPQKVVASGSERLYGFGFGIFFHFAYLFSLPSCPSGSNGSRYTLSLYSWFVVPATLPLWLSLLCEVSLKCSFKISPYSSCSTGTFLWPAQKRPHGPCVFPAMLPEMIISLNPQAVSRGEPQQSCTHPAVVQSCPYLPGMGWNRTARDRRAGSTGGNNHCSATNRTWHC